MSPGQPHFSLSTSRRQSAGETLASSRDRHTSAQTGRDRLRPLLLRIVDLGILAVLFVAPLVMGGRHPLGKLTLAVIVWVTVVCWFATRSLERDAKWSWSGMEFILLVAAMFVVIQIAPLPDSAIQALAPAQAQLLPMWSADTNQLGSFGPWQSVSLTPERSRQGLCLLAAYGALFVVTYQRLKSLSDIERLLKWIATAAIFMAALGLIQYLIGNGKFLWIYEHPSRNTLYTVKGPFANQNHFAHFLALGMAPLIWWLARVSHRIKSHGYQFHTTGQREQTSTLVPVLLSLGLATVVFAGVLCFSRGGLLIIALVSVVCLGVHAATGQITKRMVMGTTGLVLAVTMAVFIHGRQRLHARLGTITAGSLDQIDPSGARRRIWAAVADAIPDFAVFGSGIGSHGEVYPIYMSEWSEHAYSHAESGYLQVLLEAGLPGFAFVVAAIALTGYWLMTTLRHSSSQRMTTCAGILTAVWIATVLHSVIDFVWYIPACMSCTVLFMASAGRLYQLAKNAERDPRALALSRFNWIACTIVIAFVAILSIRLQARPALAAKHWESYLRMSRAAQGDTNETPRAGRFEPGTIGKLDQKALSVMGWHLQQALLKDPNNARTHLRLATNYLRRFETAQQVSQNPMSLPSIREAAISSGFESLEAQNKWLAVATGEHLAFLDRAQKHAMRALQLCPLQGKGYLHLSELAFLHGHDSARKAMIAQSVTVRPYDGACLFSAGYEAIQDGDLPTASAHFKQAFHDGPDIQGIIIESLAPLLHPEAFIAAFEPDWMGLQKLFEYYRQSNQFEQATIVGGFYTRSLESIASSATGRESARLWNLSQETHGFLQQIPQAVHAARNAVAADPSNYQLNFLLASRLQQAGAHQEALEQFRWCQRRRPKDQAVLARLAQIEHQIR